MQARTPEEWREILGSKVSSYSAEQLREFSTRVRDYSTMLARITRNEMAERGPRLLQGKVAG